MGQQKGVKKLAPFFAFSGFVGEFVKTTIWVGTGFGTETLSWWKFYTLKNHDAQFEIGKQFKERQEKLVYYIIALCVASIGFSVTQTINQKLNCTHILLGVSFISWSASIFCGFQFIKIVLLGSHANIKYFQVISDHPAPRVEEEAKKILIEKANEYSKRSTRNFSAQHYLFYIGIVTFIAWHVIQMATE